MFYGPDPEGGAPGASGILAPSGDDAASQVDWAVDDRRTALVIADRAIDEDIAAMAMGAGFRVTGAVTLEDMPARLALTVGVDALVVDLRGLAANGAVLARCLATLSGWPGWADVRPLLLVDLDAAETVLGSLALSFDRLLCEPSLSDIGLALCLLMREGGAAPCLRDVGRDTDAARLEQLSAEVRRLAQTIDRLARDDHGDVARGLRDRDQSYAPPPAARTEDSVGIVGEEVRTVLAVRRLRERFLPADMFADPAWDMMLDLMGARIDGKRVSVSSLCIAAAVPPTTALRWIAQLTERGIFERRNDPHDARRVFISLSDAAAGSLADWFSAARRIGVRFTQAPG